MRRLGELPIHSVATAAIISMLFLLSGCIELGQKSESVLVVAVEGLGFSQTNCAREPRPESGFDELCRHSVRFSHAYSVSSFSAANIGALLTGKYPFQNGLRDHASTFLNPEIQTVAEVARRRKFDTSFISSGPPVLRKTLLHQGFQVFDDTIPSNAKYPFKGASNIFTSFLDWQDNVHQFFSVLYLSDLLYPRAPTTNDLGDQRALLYDSQMEELDESLWDLIQELQKRKVWDQLTFVLVGVSGSRSVVEPFALRTGQTQVSLLIKPPRKPRDEPIRWSVDQNVSLTDVGLTLRDLIEKPKEPSRELPLIGEKLESRSLTQLLRNPENDSMDERSILAESPASYAVRRANLLFVASGEQTQTYNSLVDHEETNPLRSNDGPYLVFSNDAMDVIRKIPPQTPMQSFQPRSECIQSVPSFAHLENDKLKCSRLVQRYVEWAQALSTKDENSDRLRRAVLQELGGTQRDLKMLELNKNLWEVLNVSRTAREHLIEFSELWKSDHFRQNSLQLFENQ